jgi:hypothetical protein
VVSSNISGSYCRYLCRRRSRRGHRYLSFSLSLSPSLSSVVTQRFKVRCFLLSL